MELLVFLGTRIERANIVVSFGTVFNWECRGVPVYELEYSGEKDYDRKCGHKATRVSTRQRRGEIGRIDKIR